MIVLQFQYKPLFRLTFENNYFKDNLLRNYKIRPTQDTSNLIESIGLLYKDTETGFDVLADNCRPEQLIMRLDKVKNANSKLRFLLYVKDPIFKNYTDIPFDTNFKLFYFSNKELGEEQSGNLSKSEYVSSEDLYNISEDQSLEGLEGVAAPADEKGLPIGLIELELNQNIVNKFNDKLMDNEVISFDYKISFNSRSVIWKYFIIPAYNKKLKGLNISPQSNNDKIKFHAPKEVLIKDKFKALMFESEEPFKYCEFYDFSFQLKRGESGNGGKTIIKKLQFAPIDQIKPIDNKETDKYCSEIYVYI